MNVKQILFSISKKNRKIIFLQAAKISSKTLLLGVIFETIPNIILYALLRAQN